MNLLVVNDEKDVEIMFRQKLRIENCSGEIELVFAFSTLFSIFSVVNTYFFLIT